jgi:signal transduction histidine kinase/ActR/RegA family two-component response regulator
MPQQERHDHEKYTKSSNLHSPRIINQARDLTGLRKDGSLFPMELNVSPLKGSVHGFIGILRDISERKRYELELVAAKNEAETANSAKSQFLASMSHELRTPLNAILGFAQLFEFDESLNEDQKENIQEIHTAGKHLLQLINEVLDLVKIESNQLEISIEPIDISELLGEVIHLSTPLAQQGNISISFVNQAENIMVLADHLRLKQIFINLLSNATKYNRPDGNIIVEISNNVEQGKVKISITDTGYGISQDKIKYVFEPFNRLGAETGGIEGTGIGLVITKQLVESMNGNIGFESGKDKGCVFWVQLPVHSKLAITEQKKHINYKRPQESNTENTYTLLYVEDPPASQRLMKQILSLKKEYQLILASTAEEGLEIAYTQTPDLVLMDINLPGMNGLEAMKKIREHPGYKNIPIVALSANAMKHDIERGIQAGFDNYLSKPVNIGLLLQTLKDLLADKH